MEDLAPSIVRQRMIVEGIPTKTLSDEDINTYLARLSEKLGMTTLIEPVTHHSPQYGWSGWIHWEESGAHMYAWDDPLFFSIDIYTCKAFEEETVVEFTKEFFKPTKLVFKSV